MKVLLMHRDRVPDLQQAGPWNERTLTQDLELDTVEVCGSSPHGPTISP
jgi:hypothetical protein